MKFFVDTADLKEIRELAETGLLDGVIGERRSFPARPRGASASAGQSVGW